MVQATISKESETMQEGRSPSKGLRVCFVCTGNTCRSPMAEAVANDMARKLEWSMEIFSAGLYAVAGDPIAAHAVSALENAGVQAVPGHDYHTHVAHTLEESEAESFDLLVGMGKSHAMELMMRFPCLARRIVCMPEPISDPYGGSLGVYENCLGEITKGIQELLFSEEAL